MYDVNDPVVAKALLLTFLKTMVQHLDEDKLNELNLNIAFELAEQPNMQLAIAEVGLLRLLNEDLDAYIDGTALPVSEKVTSING